MDRAGLRKEKIKARDSMNDSERMVLSQKIVEQILMSEEFQKAKNVMIYKGIRGEVRLEALEAARKTQCLGVNEQRIPIVGAKRLLYPLCISDSEMIALLPDSEDAWQSGYFGIQEPIRERSKEIAPEDIDLVICPCTVFDEQGGRMGMGAGFYDRYLEKCTNAVVAAVAFECQKTERVPLETWDKPMDLIFTEDRIYRTKR